MKIYFATAITGNSGSRENTFRLIEYLKKYGEVIDETAGWNEEDSSLTPESVYERDFEWLKEADVLIAEITTKSLGVGYEIGRATELNKKILCLYCPDDDRKISPIITGCRDLVFKQYNNLEEAFRIIDDFLVNL